MNNRRHGCGPSGHANANNPAAAAGSPHHNLNNNNNNLDLPHLHVNPVFMDVGENPVQNQEPSSVRSSSSNASSSSASSSSLGRNMASGSGSLNRIHGEGSANFASNHANGAGDVVTLPVQANSAINAANQASWGWQANTSSVIERLQFLLNNNVLSDVMFVVGKDESEMRMPAHKFVLTMGSAVFDAMFNGPLATKEKEIRIPDIEPQAFSSLLKFLYTDELGDITHYSVMTTLYVAKKYAVPALQAACVEFLKRNLRADNACLLVTQARLFDEADLANLCMETIDQYTLEAIAAEGFYELAYDTLCSVLERDTLHIRERKLFEAVEKWAEHECGRQAKPVDSPHKREVLGNALDLIRFPVMTIEEFAQGPAQSGLLNDREVKELFLYYTLNPKPETRFPCIPRSCLAGKEYVCTRFQATDNRWGYSGTADRIRFTVDRQIFVLGLGLYGSTHGPAEYVVQMQIILSSNQRVLAQHESSFSSDGSESIFRVMFKKPVEIQPGVHYTISACLKGPDSFYGTRGSRKVTKQIGKDAVITFNFIYSPGNNNGTSVEDGQIPEIIFCTI